jgi:protein SCO1/2
MHKLTLMILALASWTIVACGPEEPTYRGTQLDPARPVEDFVLTDQRGEPFHLGDQRGKVVVLFFGYTFCPDVCPTTLGTWKRVHESLGEDAQDVRFVFVTVDPERDSPEQLKRHIETFNPDFVGLTGALEELTPVYQTFGVFYEKDTQIESAAGYLVNHTASIFVVDPAGKWRLKYSFGTEVEDIVHDIRQLLR